MPETTPLIKAALNLRVGVGFDVYQRRFCMDEKTNLVEVKLSFPLYCIANE